jgi:hypothetical protein
MLLVNFAETWDGPGLGRFDGVDRRSDTPLGSGFDSRALQPRLANSRCEAVVDVVSSATCQVVETLETREALQQCGASFFFGFFPLIMSMLRQAQHDTTVPFGCDLHRLSVLTKCVIETGWGASMVSTADLIPQAAPGSIPGRSSRKVEFGVAKSSLGVLESDCLGYQSGTHIETHEAPQ